MTEIEVTESGLVLPSEQVILEEMLDLIINSFGGNLNRNLDTPQGQLASSLTAIIANKNNQIAWLANQIHPDYADGFMQDAIAKLYFLERKQSIKSSVVCTFTGLPGTIIPNGFIVQDKNGNDWTLADKVSILADGKVDGTLTAAAGTSAASGTVNVLISNIVGLDRVTNDQDAIIGSLVEDRETFRERRQNSVAINAQGMCGAVYGNVGKLQDVVDVYVIDNPSGQSVTTGETDYPLAPHSVLVSVIGGDDYKIAEIILRYSGNGCDFNGNKTVTVKDERYSDPKPSYEVKFLRPTQTPIYFKIRIKTGAIIGAESLIKNAIIDYFSQNTSSKIAASIYSADFFGTVKSISGVRLLDIQVGKSMSSFVEEIKLGVDQMPSISAENIIVVEE